MRQGPTILCCLLSAQSVWGEGLCYLCPDTDAEQGHIQVGVAQVNGVDPWRGSQLPWTDDGGSPQLEVDYATEDANSGYLEAGVRVDSGSLYGWEVETGKKNSWVFDLSSRHYEIRHDAGARTPYAGIGGSNLTLPAGWVFGANTNQMTNLDALSGPVTLGREHTDTGVGVAYSVAPQWRLTARLSERKSEGLATHGGVIGTNHNNGRSVILPAPVDHTTRNFEFGAEYSGARNQLSLALLFSEFDNDHQRLRWDNPYSNAGLVPQGSMGLAPDNRFAQFELQGAHSFSQASRLSYNLAFGSYTQDQEFEPYTIRPGLVGGVLPRSSLDGRVDSWIAGVRFAHDFDNRVSLNLKYRFRKLENKTPSSTYNYVIADFAQSAVPRTNLTYDFTKNEIGAELAYPLLPSLRLQAGADLSRTDRTNQEVEQTDEAGLWGKVNWAASQDLDLSLRGEISRRRADEYGVVAEIVPPENPLMRKYTLANLDRVALTATANQQLTDKLSLGLRAHYAETDYPDTGIGLTATDESSLTADLAYMPESSWSATLFTGYDRYDSKQLGSAAYAQPDWSADIEDSAFSVGGRIDWQPDGGRFEHSLEVTRIMGKGDISVQGAAYPETRATATRGVYRGKYQYTENLSAVLELWYERYDEQDWAVENVAADSVTRVLSLGEGVTDQTAVAAVVSLIYEF